MNMIKSKSQHIGWIDYAKSLAIFLVVLLHTHCVSELSVAINSFIMPLFFFLSGFLFSRKNNPLFRPFIIKRFRQLVIPYLWINILVYILWLTVLRNWGNDAEAGIRWHEPLVAIALGIPPGLTHDIPLWSLLCFFVIEIIYYPLSSKLSDEVIAVNAYIVASVISIFASATPHGEGWALPFTLAPASGALAFYALGHTVRAHSDYLRRFFTISPLILLLGISLLMCGLSLNSPVAFFTGILGNPAWFILTSLGGIITAIQIAIWLNRIFKDGAIIRLMSRGTLLICGFHIPAFAVIKGIMLFGFGVAPAILTDGLIPGLAMSIATCALCLPLIYIIERYFRFLVSK